MVNLIFNYLFERDERPRYFKNIRFFDIVNSFIGLLAKLLSSIFIKVGYLILEICFYIYQKIKMIN